MNDAIYLRSIGNLFLDHVRQHISSAGTVMWMYHGNGELEVKLVGRDDSVQTHRFQHSDPEKLKEWFADLLNRHCPQ